MLDSWTSTLAFTPTNTRYLLVKLPQIENHSPCWMTMLYCRGYVPPLHQPHVCFHYNNKISYGRMISCKWCKCRYHPSCLDHLKVLPRGGFPKCCSVETRYAFESIISSKFQELRKDILASFQTSIDVITKHPDEHNRKLEECSSRITQLENSPFNEKSSDQTAIDNRLENTDSNGTLLNCSEEYTCNHQ